MELNGPQHEQPLNVTTKADAFLNHLKGQGKSPNTLKNYKTDLDLFKKYIIEKQNHPEIKDFNLTKVMEYGSFLDKKYTSDNSKRRRVQTLRLFFDYLVGQGYITENPVRKLPTSPKFLDIPRPTSLADLHVLWDHLCSEGHGKSNFEALLAKRNQVVFLLIFGSGLKVSDLTSLKKDHISLDGENRVLITPPRRDPYSVPLHSMFSKVYGDYQAHLADYKLDHHIEFDNVLFNANPYKILSGGISARGLEIIFEDLRKKLNITLTPKSLRQAGIFNWLHCGHTDLVIKEWMGVAPSYSMKLYKDHSDRNVYSDQFIEATYFKYVGSRMNQ